MSATSYNELCCVAVQDATIAVTAGGSLSLARLDLNSIVGSYTTTEAGSLAAVITSMSGDGSRVTFDTVTVPQHPDWGTLSGTVRIGIADEDYLVTDPPDLLSGLSSALGDSLPLLLFQGQRQRQWP
eukprot:SAG11_NODE_9700_length_888_cov_1.210393_1_plen_127_part_00